MDFRGIGQTLVPHLGGGAVVTPPPAGFTYTPPFTITRIGSTFSVGTFDVADYAPTGKAYYVSTTGNDSNDGLTVDTPLRKIATAIAKSDVVVIYIKPGIYGRTFGTNGLWNTKTLAIRRWPGETGRIIIHGGQDDLSWALDETYTNTYRATRSAVIRVLDGSIVDADGYVERLTQQTSAADVDANPGSWHLDGSNVLWVRTTDDRAPDANIWPLLVTAFRSRGDITIYAEYCDIYSPNTPILESTAALQTPKLYLNNCGFYHFNSNGLSVEGVTETICQNCVAAKNDQDGFNYHIQDSIVPYAIEINCVGKNNGIADGTGNDNGSSMHDGGQIIRINGVYNGNIGPNVIESAADSWNLGVTAHTSESDVAGADINFCSAGGDMWLDRCVSYGSTYDLVAGAGDTIYTRQCTTDGNNGGAGTITEY